MKSIASRLVSFGSFVPSRVVTNTDLEKIMDTSDEWIQQRSGIVERRWISEGETLRLMAKTASEQALSRAGWTADDVDAIIFSTLLSDYVFPGSGVLLQHDLGGKRFIPALDIRNQCSGFIYALQIADAWIKAGMYKKVMIATAEIHSTSLVMSPEGRDLGVLFGDGASTCLVEACDPEVSGHVLDTLVFSQGEHAKKLAVLEPSPNSMPRLSVELMSDKRSFPYMDGRFVFKHAVDRMVESMKEICERNRISAADIDFVVPHQANKRINQMVLAQLGIPEEKTHYTIDRYGNTTSVTIPITFDEAVEKKKIKRGDLVALSAFGSGFTWGAALLRF